MNRSFLPFRSPRSASAVLPLLLPALLAASDSSVTPPGPSEQAPGEDTAAGFAVIDLGPMGPGYTRRPVVVGNKMHVLIEGGFYEPSSVWHPAGEYPLEADVPGNWVYASDMNNNGVVVGGVHNDLYDPYYADGTETVAAVWDQGSSQPTVLDAKSLPEAENLKSMVYAINDNKEILGYRNMEHGVADLRGTTSGWGESYSSRTGVMAQRYYPNSSNPGPSDWQYVVKGTGYEPIKLADSGDWIGPFHHRNPIIFATIYSLHDSTYTYADGNSDPDRYGYVVNGEILPFRPVDLNDEILILGNDGTVLKHEEGSSFVLASTKDFAALSSPGPEIPLFILSGDHLFEQKRDPETGSLLPIADGNFDRHEIAQIVENASPRNSGDGALWTAFTPYAMSDNGAFITGTADNADTGERHAALLLKVDVEEVSFSGEENYHQLQSDDLITTYDAPQWLDLNGDGDATDPGENNYPVAYTRNASPSINVKVSAGVDLSAHIVMLRAFGPGSIAVPETTASVDGLNITFDNEVICSGNFVDTVKFYNAQEEGKEFRLEWEMRIDSSNWFSIGRTLHTLYLTRSAPASPIFTQESHFYIACEPADGLSDEEEIFDAIWAEFSDRNVSRVVKSTGLGTRDPNGMIYWKPGSSNDCPTLLDFLKQGYGRCENWAFFFANVLYLHDISSASVHGVQAPEVPSYSSVVQDYASEFSYTGELIFLTSNGEGAVDTSTVYPRRVIRFIDNGGGGNNDGIFYVNTVDFSGNRFVPKPPNNAGLPISSSKAQGNENARAWFGNHAIIRRRDGRFYDPSYGAGPFESQLKWEDASIQGYGSWIEVIEKTSSSSPTFLGEFLYYFNDDVKNVIETY